MVWSQLLRLLMVLMPCDVSCGVETIASHQSPQRLELAVAASYTAINYSIPFALLFFANS